MGRPSLNFKLNLRAVIMISLAGGSSLVVHDYVHARGVRLYSIYEV